MVLKVRILTWFAIAFSSGPHSVSPLHHDPRLRWPHTAWLNFIELDKAVVCVIILASFCNYYFSVSALWRPPETPTISLGFLLSWTLGISYLGRWISLHGCSNKMQPLLLTLDTVAPPDLECGVALLGPPAPLLPPLLGHGFAPLGLHL